MTVQIFRVYTDMKAESKDYAFSVLASEADARYVVPEEMAKSFDVDESRIEALTRAFYNDGSELPDTHIGWASLAMTNMDYLVLMPTEEPEYLSMDEAEEDERAFATSILSGTILEEETE